MSVNNMQIEDVYQILNSIHTQATGKTAIAPTNTSEFVSMATTTLAAGTDAVYNTMMQVITRTIFSVRPYQRKFSGLVMSNDRWGAITRKISFADKPLQDAEAVFHPIDGQTIDQYKINKADVLEMRYYGSAVYQDSYTVFRDQLTEAFSGPEQLGSFISAMLTNMSNKWEQYLENLNRATLANFIGAKNDLSNGVIHLLTEYNYQTQQTLTLPDIWKEPNMAHFFRWMRARINTLGRRMAERSEEYQVKITGKDLNKHTPYADQRIYLHADILDQIDTMINTTTFHDEPLAYADVEGVSYWQAIDNPLQIQVTPSVINANGVVSAGNAQTMANVVGVMFDRDAIGTNVYLYEAANTPYNARGRYYNTWLTARVRYMNDLTEKGIILMLD